MTEESKPRLVLELPAAAGGARHPLPERGNLVIGSESSCDVVVPKIAARHAVVARVKGGGYGLKILDDFESALLNERPVKSAKLALGDRVTLGPHVLRVLAPKAAKSKARTADAQPRATEQQPSASEQQARTTESQPSAATEAQSSAATKAQSSAATEASSILDRTASRVVLPGFRIEKSLGRGAMGRVLLAHQENLDRKVALKLLDPKLIEDERFVASFRDEARAAAALHHANVVTVFDVGEHEGQPYLVLEYMDRGSLEDRLRRDGALPWRAVLGVLRDAAAGLEFAASKGIVHRDIKPANLMQNAAGETKIADLGLATAAEETLAGGGEKIHGTPHFMAPEQARGESLDARADIYSLGASAWRLLTARTPYQGSDAKEILRAAMTESVPRAAESVPGLPAAVDELIASMMAKSAAERPSDAAELRHRVEALIASDGASSGSPVSAGSGRGKLIGLGAAALLVGAAGFGAKLLWLDGAGDSQQRTEARSDSLAGGINAARSGIEGDGERAATERTESTDLGADESADDGLREFEELATRALRESETLTDIEARRAAFEDVAARFAGTDAAREARMLADVLPDSDAASETLDGRDAEVAPATSAEFERAAAMIAFEVLAKDESGESLSPRAALERIAIATPAEVLAGRPAPSDDPELLEARNAVLADLVAQFGGEARQRVEDARSQIEAGEFDAAGSALDATVEWLTTPWDEPSNGPVSAAEDGAADAAPSDKGGATDEPESGAESDDGGGAGGGGGAAGARQLEERMGIRPAAAQDPDPKQADTDDEASSADDTAPRLTRAARAVLAALDTGELDSAEAACRALLEALPRYRLERAEWLRQVDFAALTEALGGERLIGLLEAADFSAARALLAPLEGELRHPAYVESFGQVAQRLDEVQGVVEFLSESWKSDEWRRRTVPLPPSTRGGEIDFAEAISIDQRGITVEGDAGQQLVSWADYTVAPEAALLLVRERLSRDWSLPEAGALSSWLQIGGWIVASEQFREALAGKRLQSADFERLNSAMQPAIDFGMSPEAAGGVERDLLVAADLSSVARAMRAEDWTTVAFVLEHVFDNASDAGLVWLLGDGQPIDRPAVWPPSPWADADPDGRESIEASAPAAPGEISGRVALPAQVLRSAPSDEPADEPSDGEPPIADGEDDEEPPTEGEPGEPGGEDSP